ncbi:MAG: NAD(P)/FAD-dependent oxidoreductase [Erysipelotrichaceae bacterium]
MKHFELIIIGGGSAGLSAAVSAFENGVRDILVLERDKELGGILQQCIHNGFGVHTFKEELSGPSFAERFINLVKEKHISYKLNAMVIHLNDDKTLEYVSPEEGYNVIKASAIILAMGCRERTRGAIAVPGYRPAGVWSAGTAQRYINMEGFMVGKKIFILGSGDIGLIMARRLTLEGAEVKGVAEIMPYSNGLPRNIKQCLEDFNIPLFLSHTITKIDGLDRVSGVTIAQVDESMRPIPNTEKTFDVDTVLFSIGLIPENALSEEANIEMDPKTRGPKVDESYQTSLNGVFACGNVLHVHDLVDFVAEEGRKAGIAAAKYINSQLEEGRFVNTLAKKGIGYIVPQRIHPVNLDKTIELMFRVTKQYKNVEIVIKNDDEVLRVIKKKHLAPAEMEKVILKASDVALCQQTLTIEVVEEVA